MTRQQYIRNQQAVFNRMMKNFYPLVYAALKADIGRVATEVRKDGVSGARRHIPHFSQRIGPVITDLYTEAARLAVGKYHLNVKGFGDNFKFVKSVLDFFKRHLLSKVVVPINQTTTRFIEKTLNEAIQNGWGADETASRLEDDEMTKARARMIVRTETVRAANFAQLAAADNETYEVEKEWIAVEDSRTRTWASTRGKADHTHAGVDGQRVGLYEPYNNGLMFPGDPMGSAAQTINCRCTQGFFLKRDANGRPIPKKNPGLNLLTQMNLGRQAA